MFFLFRSVRHPGPLGTAYKLSAAPSGNGVLNPATRCVKKSVSKFSCPNLSVKMSLEIWLLVPLHNPPQGSRGPRGPTQNFIPRALFAPLGRKNRVPRGLQKRIKFWCHFNIDFWAFWLRFGRPRWLQNRSKIYQNWVSEPFCFGIAFCIDFWSSFAPNFDPLDLKQHCFS